ncbi:MAG TPA: acyl-CoA dehydrogenase family protein [Acidimicrobiales bacterium]|nr:acyl-CoA dehydrogenase family protein [Acidimicrobiales bacterium]
MVVDEVGEQKFEAEATAFLEANATRRPAERIVWGEGSDRVGLFPDKTREQDLAEVADAKAWKTKAFDAGFGWITGPIDYGGRGLAKRYERIYATLESQFAIPSQSPFGIGLGMVAPTILAHGTPTVKDRYLRAMYRGELVGCQLFSEPAAGSDLAGVQMKAERDGDEWIVTGQKVWTSGAHYSDVGEVICRTDPSLPKHKGLSCFVVDMHAAGVEVRPLRQMTGGSSFNEVFFDEVRVPADHLLGDVNGGWTVALTTLMNERAAIGGGGGGVGSMAFARLVELAQHMGKATDPLARQRLAEVFIQGQVARFTGLRAMEKVRAGQLPGPEMSIGKLSLTNNMLRIGELVALLLGPRLVADTGEWGTYAWADYVLGVPGMRIAGGTDEVMKKIVGERVLGLPKESVGP